MISTPRYTESPAEIRLWCGVRGAIRLESAPYTKELEMLTTDATTKSEGILESNGTPDPYELSCLISQATLPEIIIACGGEVVGSYPTLTIPGNKEVCIRYSSITGCVILVSGETEIPMPGIKSAEYLSGLYQALSGTPLEVKHSLYLRLRVVLRKMRVYIDPGSDTRAAEARSVNESVPLVMLLQVL